MTILRWIKDLLDPPLLLLFILMYGYSLIADLPGLRRKGLDREAKAVAVMDWTGIGLCLGFLVLVMVT